MSDGDDENDFSADGDANVRGKSRTRKSAPKTATTKRRRHEEEDDDEEEVAKPSKRPKRADDDEDESAENAAARRLPKDKTFAATFAKTALFKRWINAIKDVFTNIVFECSTFGIKVHTMDASHVAMLDAELKADGFAAYKCDRPVQLGVFVDHLEKIVRGKPDESSVTISARADEDTINLEFRNESDDDTSLFALKLIVIDEEKNVIDETPGYSVAYLPSKTLQRICNEAMNVAGDTFDIRITPDGVRFATACDIGSGEWNLKCKDPTDRPAPKAVDAENEEEGIAVSCVEPVSSEFKLRYFKDFIKATSLALRVVVRVHTTFPMELRYDIEGIGRISYWLAPVIKDGDVPC